MAAADPKLIESAWRLATASRAAYAGLVGPATRLNPAADPDFAALGLTTLEVFAGPSTDTNAFLAEGPDDLLLAFRGSLSLANWAVNVSFELAPWSCGAAKGCVHAGFAAAWAEVSAAVRAAVAARRAGGKPLLLAGHSLGGALAVFAARELAAEGVPVQQVQTFGAPRVGDAAYCASWTLPAERWVNHQDPVPLMPWSGPFVQGYEHVGRLHYLAADGSLRTEASVWSRFQDQLLGLGQATGSTLQAKAAEQVRRRLADHDIGAYLAKLQALRR